MVHPLSFLIRNTLVSSSSITSKLSSLTGSNKSPYVNFLSINFQCSLMQCVLYIFIFRIVRRLLVCFTPIQECLLVHAAEELCGRSRQLVADCCMWGCMDTRSQPVSPPGSGSYQSTSPRSPPSVSAPIKKTKPC